MAKQIYKDKTLEVNEVISAKDNFVATPASDVAELLTANLQQADLEITAEEALDLLVSYLVPVIGLTAQDNTAEGVCKMCGKKTSTQKRCVCVNCMNVHGKDIYEQLKQQLK